MRSLLAAVLLALVPAAAVAQADAGTYRASSELNVRAAPSIGAELIGVIPPSGRVTVFTCDLFGWCQVQYQDLQGWAARQFLVRTGDLPADTFARRFGSPPAVPTATGPTAAIEVTGRLVARAPCATVRTEDGTEYPLVGNVPFNSVDVRIVGQQIATDACGTATALVVFHVRIDG
jgi:uncharacterized protein YraI